MYRYFSIFIAAFFFIAVSLHAQTTDPSLPHLIQENGRHALIVDGEPFFMLGGQARNSSAWRATITYGAGRGWGPPQESQPEAGTEDQPKPSSRAVIAQPGENEFVVKATQCRGAFEPNGANTGKPWQFLKVEGGHYEDATFKCFRLRNGDEVGWGTVSVGAEPVVRIYEPTGDHLISNVHHPSVIPHIRSN